MALHIKALNDDTSFLLSFIPSVCPVDQKFPESFPGAFTILIDPIAPSQDANELAPKRRSCITSLNDVSDVDAILISQAAPDHCHEESLCQLSPHVQSMIVGEPNAIKKMKRWRHFDNGNLCSLRRYKRGRSDTLFTVEIPPPSPLGSSGQVTIALLAAKSGSVHNAIGITYREPSSILSRSRARIGSPPLSSQASHFKSISSAASYVTSTTGHAGYEPTIAVIYSPHGVSYDVLEPWISSHLAFENASPVAILHSTTTVNAPWYNGGNMIAGCTGGLELARQLLPTVWVAAHDFDNTNINGAVKSVYRQEYNILDIEAALWEELIERGVKRKPQIMKMEPGETIRVAEYSVNKIADEQPKQEVEEERHVAEHGTESTMDVGNSKNEIHSGGV